MATMQKEKPKKKKKLKEVSVDTVFKEDCESISHNELLLECEKSSNVKVENPKILEIKNLKFVDKECLSLENQSLIKDDILDNISSTPNVACVSNLIKEIGNIEQIKLAKYPDLATIEKEDNNLNEVNKFVISRENSEKPNPMTKIQLNELYDCKMLDLVKQFELEFLNTTLHQNFDNDPLCTLLQKYAFERSKIKVNSIDLNDLENKFVTLKDVVWKRSNIISEPNSGLCYDNVRVTANEKYEIFEIDQTQFQNLITILNNKYELTLSYIKNKINAESTRLKIEQIIREILHHPCFSRDDLYLNKKTNFSNKDSLILQGLSYLRRALSILFNCTRKPTPDQIFTTNIIEWISMLVSAYLKIATIEDHWFLFFHILRSPSGVSDWATNFIQIAEPNIPNENNLMESMEINHCLTILHVLLLPIKKRNEFLYALSKSHREISDPVKDDIWILIDSDGEEGNDHKGECAGLKENDLISFLNQIPFEMIFRCLINAEKIGNDYKIENNRITEHQFLQIIAFNTKLVEIFGAGLLTYNTERYKQFAKRLGRLIRHTVHYLSDIHEIFLRNKLSKNPQLCEKITVEMNSFIIKSCSYIYKTRNLATWQYFSSLPFALLECDTLWQLFFYFNVGFPNEFPVPNEDFQNLIHKPNFWDRFNLAVSDLSSEDLYYLIQAFFEMANERDRTRNWEFIETVCLHIFMIGFVNESTRETCYKTSRDMITNLIFSYPELITSLIQQIKIRFNETDNLIYLIKSIPLENWKTDIQSFEILSMWLLNYNYDRKENALARIIISHLNWSFDTDNRLFLPHNIHVRMACLICEALNKHNTEIIGSSKISENLLQVSNLIENHCNKEQFTAWCWNMILLLRLHLMDQNCEALKKTLQNPKIHLCFVPELEKFEIIYQGVIEKRPLALYISVLISSWGHSIPLICQKGIPQMKILLSDHRYTSVIRCIQLITPLFLESPDILAKCENFQEVLKIILNADRTYLKIAKDLVGANCHGPVFQHFMNMIQSQIIHYYETGLNSPSLIIHLWLEILLNFQNWQNTNVTVLIDAILTIAYQFSDSWGNCKEFFREYYRNSCNWKTERLSTLKMLLGSVNQYKEFPTLSTDCGWLSLLLLELEHETQEKSNSLWSEFLRYVLKNDGKSIESILKKICSEVYYPQFSLSSLVLYKYANLIANSNIDHPLLPIFGQKFFLLFLERINFSQEEQRFHHIYSVSDKFYEYNIPLMKKIKSKFTLAADNYCKLSEENANNEVLSYFYLQCSKIMKTYLLWLEETDIIKIPSYERIDLPPQYNAEKLSDILNGNEQHWTEFIFLRKIRDKQKDASNNWLKYCLRFHEIKPRSIEILQSKQKINPVDRIKNHLKSYDKLLEPPVYNKIPLIFNPVSVNSINSSTLDELRKELKYVNEYTKKLNFKLKVITSLNKKFKDEIQFLYQNVPYSKTVQKCCSNVLQTCKGPANITLELRRPEKIESIQRKLDENREKYEKLNQDILNKNSNTLVYSIHNMEHIVRCLFMAREEIAAKEGYKNNIQVTRVAIDFFYDLLQSFDNKQIIELHNENFSSLIRELGIFIQNNQESESLRILQMSFKRPEIFQILSDFFIPNKTTPNKFIDLYKFLIDAHISNHDGKAIFSLLSKFDVCNWLQSQEVQLAHVNSFLKILLCGLENWNKPESSFIQEIFRQHLTYLFNYNFPNYCLEILQQVPTRVSEQKICTVLLLDLLNVLLKKAGCDNLTLESVKSKIEEECEKFSNQQNFLDFQTINNIILLFSQHFKDERLRNGLHGLYPKHKNYCFTLSIWFLTLSRTLMVSSISTYPGVLGNQICDSLFASIVSLYSPWIVIYKQKDFEQLTANWVKQFIKDKKDLLPWSEGYLEFAQPIIKSFTNCLQIILKSIPASNIILDHTFGWYHHHFLDQNSSKNSIQIEIHNELKQLPWEKFSPQLNHIDYFNNMFSEINVECRSFLAYIFIKIQWSSWIKEQYHSWNFRNQSHAINLLLPIFIKISFESNINLDLRLVARILEESLEFPWHIVDFQNVEAVVNWLVLTVNPIIVLNLPTETVSTNAIILKLLRVICGMSKLTKMSDIKFQTQTKRILYVKSIVRMLHACSNNNDKLLATSKDLKAFQIALVELLDNIEKILQDENSITDRELEGQNLVLEIVGSLQNSSQISKLFVDGIIYWQSQCNPGSIVLTLTLNSFTFFKTFNYNMYFLMETTLYNYFRFASEINTQVPSWTTVMEKFNCTISNFDYKIILTQSNFLILHIYILYKFQNMTTLGEKITFLQDVAQNLDNIKMNEMIESRLVLVWGAIVTFGCKLLVLTENAKKMLLMIARQLYIIAKESEGWTGSLLGAIGIRRNSNVYKRKLLFRCLSSLLFKLFYDQSGIDIKETDEYVTSINELYNESMNKACANYKQQIDNAIKIIQSYDTRRLENIGDSILKLINIFYNDNFIKSALDVWIL